MLGQFILNFKLVPNTNTQNVTSVKKTPSYKSLSSHTLILQKSCNQFVSTATSLIQDRNKIALFEEGVHSFPDQSRSAEEVIKDTS